jgi:dUTP pyrophosphatase
MTDLKVKVYKLDPSAILPSRQSPDAAGYDVHCLKGFGIAEGESVVVRTGLVIQPPPGYHTELIVRSGLSFNYGIMLKNNVGVIDHGYAGKDDELKVMLYRIPPEDAGRHIFCHFRAGNILKFNAGDRIAQLLFRKTETFEMDEVSQPPKELSRGGFGSTGI